MRPRWIYRLLAALCSATVALSFNPVPSSATFPGANGRLAFGRWVSPERQDVYTVRADGTGERLAIRYADRPAWSSDGTRIAFERWGSDGFKHIYVKDMATGRTSQITSSQRSDTSPAWSPDGTKIAFLADSYRPGGEGIYYIRSTRPFGRRQLVFALPVYTHAFDPEWSPDGTKIVFDYYVDGVGDRIAVQRVGRPGSGPVLLTSGWLDEFPTWSPTGKKIAYTDIGDLTVMNADGTHKTHFATGAIIYDLAWSPDGRKIAAIIDYEYSTEIITLNPWTGDWIDSDIAWDVDWVNWQPIAG